MLASPTHRMHRARAREADRDERGAMPHSLHAQRWAALLSPKVRLRVAW